jgi:hypothetical protein
MKKLVAVITLLVLAAVPFLVVPEQVSAGSSTDAALALGAFAVFNQIVRGETIFNGSPHLVRQTVVVEQPVIVQQPAVVYAPPPPAVVYAPAPPPAVYYVPAPPPVVVYSPSGYYYPRYGYDAVGYYPAYYGAYRVR